MRLSGTIVSVMVLIAVFALPATGAPLPRITANSQDGPLTVNQGTNVAIALGLNEAPAGSADWWLAYTSAQSPNVYFFSFDAGWQPNSWAATYTGVLTDAIFTPPLVLMNEPLLPGDYTFYFGVDLTPDTWMNWEGLAFDTVNVKVQASGGNPSGAACGWFPSTLGSRWTARLTSGNDVINIVSEVTGSTSSQFTISETLSHASGDIHNTTNFLYNCNQASITGTTSEVMPGMLFSTTYNPPLLVSPAQYSQGYHVESSSNATQSNGCTYVETDIIDVLGSESVTVPAGTFNAVKVQRDLRTAPYMCNGVPVPATTNLITEWVAYGVGIVKMWESSEAHFELTSYTIK